MLVLQSGQAQFFAISVVDMLGQSLLQVQLSGSGEYAMPTGLAAGVYWVLIKTKTGEGRCLRMVVF